MSDAKVARYCPNCSARVSAAESVFQKPQKCPRCQAVVTFIDIPNAPPPYVPPADTKPPLGFLEYAAYTAAGIGLVSAILAAGCLLLGLTTTSGFFACAALALGVLPLVAFLLSRAEQLSNRKETKLLRERVATLSAANDEAVKKWRLFESEFDRLVEERRQLIYTEVDGEKRRAQEMVDFANNREKTIDQLGKRLLNDTVKWISSKLTSSNFTSQRERLIKTIEFCRKHEYQVSPQLERELLSDLQKNYEMVLRVEHERAEQARIKARIREEKRAEADLKRELARVEAEQVAIERALAEALAKAAGAHTAEVEALEAKLAEAEAKAFRALSMAQQTRAGYIYVISNIGSFGDGVYKVGMTRRLEPLMRVKELGDASVPFPFDVHMMISCDDAPKLENTLHKALHQSRVNRVNLRKEYFRTDIDTIAELVKANHGEVEYIADAEALEFRESMTMTDEEFALVSEVQEAIGIDDEDEEELEEAAAF